MRTNRCSPPGPRLNCVSQLWGRLRLGGQLQLAAPVAVDGPEAACIVRGRRTIHGLVDGRGSARTGEGAVGDPGLKAREVEVRRRPAAGQALAPELPAESLATGFWADQALAGGGASWSAAGSSWSRFSLRTPVALRLSSALASLGIWPEPGRRPAWEPIVVIREPGHLKRAIAAGSRQLFPRLLLVTDWRRRALQPHATTTERILPTRQRLGGLCRGGGCPGESRQDHDHADTHRQPLRWCVAL